MEPSNSNCFVWDLTKSVRPPRDPPGVTKFGSADIAAAADRLASWLAAVGLQAHEESWVADAIRVARALPAQEVGRVHLPSEAPEESLARLARMRTGADLLLVTRLVEASERLPFARELFCALGV